MLSVMGQFLLLLNDIQYVPGGIERTFHLSSSSVMKKMTVSVTPSPDFSVTHAPSLKHILCDLH